MLLDDTNIKGFFNRTETPGLQFCPNGSQYCGLWDPNKSTEEKACGLYFFLVPGVLCGLLCVLGLVGNILTLSVLGRLGRESVTFMLLSVLSACDTVFLLGYLLFSSIPDITYFFDRSPSTLAYVTDTRYALYPTITMAHSTSVWITTLVTTYRYITASRLIGDTTMCSRAAIYAQVIFIVCFCVIFEVPRYWERTPQLVPDTTFIELERTSLYYDKYYQILYKNLLSFIFRRLIPLTLTTIMVWKRVRLLETWRRSRARTFNKTHLPEEQERLTKVLIVLAIVFVATHIPVSIYPILRIITPPPEKSCNHFYFYFAYFADFLVVMNSSLTFYIFYPGIPRYRRIALQVICRRRAGVAKVASVSSDLDSRV